MPGTTARAAIPYVQGADLASTIDNTNQSQAEKIDTTAALFAQGLASARPTAASAAGRFYWATDTSTLSYSNGTSWVTLSAASAAEIFAPGDLKTTLAASAPAGWLLCDGSTVSRATYAGLFGVVGTQHNTGGEAGTDFRLPDLRGRIVVGKGTNADVDTLGENEGAAVADRRPRHQHTVSTAGSHSHGGGTGAAGAHSHTFLYTNNPRVNVVGGTIPATNSSDQTGNTGGVGDHAHAIGADGNHAHQVGPSGAPLDSPAYLVANVMIKT